MYVVIETNDKGVPQSAATCPSQERAIRYAIELVQENCNMGMTDAHICELLNKYGHVDTGGWTVTVLNATTIPLMD
jgi:hypothetical protein